MKRPIALLALFLAGSAMGAGPTLEQARAMVKTHTDDELCMYLFTAQSMYVDTIASELAVRHVNCSRVADELERREQSSRVNQQRAVSETLQILQTMRPAPMPPPRDTHCVTRYAAGQWYTDCN